MHMSNEELLERVMPYWKDKGWDLGSPEHLTQIVGLVKERAITLPDFVTLGEYFFVAPTAFDPKGVEKWTPENAAHLQKLATRFGSLAPFDAPSLEHAVRTYAQENNLNVGKLFQPLRLAVTGVTQGPSVFMTMQVLGKEASLSRIEYALKTLA